MWLAFGAQARELRDGEVIVGSGADADWRIATADLMPRHFTITVYDLNASLRASSKDSVVVVNQKQLLGVPRLLNDGDVIAAGSGRFVFSDEKPSGEAPSAPHLPSAFLVSTTSGAGRELLSRSTMLGRDASSAIMIDDASVSRFHAEVRREAGGYALHSMGSAGTLLNGRKVLTPLLLAEGDIVEITNRKWRFTHELPGSAAPAPRENPEGRQQWRSRAIETGTLDVVPEPPRRRSAILLAVGLLVVVAVGILLAVGRR